MAPEVLPSAVGQESPAGLQDLLVPQAPVPVGGLSAMEGQELPADPQAVTQVLAPAEERGTPSVQPAPVEGMPVSLSPNAPAGDLARMAPSELPPVPGVDSTLDVGSPFQHVAPEPSLTSEVAGVGALTSVAAALGDAVLGAVVNMKLSASRPKAKGGIVLDDAALKPTTLRRSARSKAKADEHTLEKTVHMAAKKNLETGISFTSFSDSHVLANLGRVGFKLGWTDEIIKASTVAIKNLEIDRLVVRANKKKDNLKFYKLRVMMNEMLDWMQFSATLVVI